MDIDDILASVDRDHVTSPESASLDHQLLTRFWVAERAVSELLPWPGGLMERMMERVRRQVRHLFMCYIINPESKVSGWLTNAIDRDNRRPSSLCLRSVITTYNYNDDE